MITDPAPTSSKNFNIKKNHMCILSFLQISGASRWRVCYQLGLTILVLYAQKTGNSIVAIVEIHGKQKRRSLSACTVSAGLALFLLPLFSTFCVNVIMILMFVSCTVGYLWPFLMQFCSEAESFPAGPAFQDRLIPSQMSNGCVA